MEVIGDFMLIDMNETERLVKQMRRDLYSAKYQDVYSRQIKDGYGENRTELKTINSELNELLYRKRSKLMDLVQKYVWEERWKKIPNSLKLDVKNAKLVGHYDGNSKTLLAEDDQYFYVACHSGS